MDNILTNLENILKNRSVENIRVEYKATWNSTIMPSFRKTVCAFANDILNLNGGYIIVGVEEQGGVPVFPPRGLPGESLERIQKEMRGACKSIDPEYQPIIVPKFYLGQWILCVWVPGGDNRPYKAPDDRNHREQYYFVRQGAETVRATGESLRQLLELTARTPFDDRRHQSASLLDLSPMLAKKFLHEIRSELLNLDPPVPDVDLYRHMQIVSTMQDVYVPKNVGLMFFSERPDKFFPGARFEVVQFGDGEGGNLIEEKIFTGPIDSQITGVLSYINNLTSVQLRKIPGEATVERSVAFPYEALEEAIVNAAYHRSYESSTEPNKVYLYPDRLEIISYPGPVAGISQDHLNGTTPMPPVPARNRRIGEFLKELRLAEMRGTGIPKIRRTMAQNGSPDPKLDFDEGRTYFRVILPAHPRYLVVHSLRESAYLWSIGEKTSAVNQLLTVFRQNTNSGAVAGQLIDYLFDLGDLNEADEIFRVFHASSLKHEGAQPYLRYFKLLMPINPSKARQVMELLPESEFWSSAYEVGVAFKRLKVFDKAHMVFSRMFGENEDNVHYLYNYAQTKLSIASGLSKKPVRDWPTIRRLQREAIELLRRVIALDRLDRTELAWCWFRLAKALMWDRYPRTQIEEAFQRAMELLPHEAIFTESYQTWSTRQNRPLDGGTTNTGAARRVLPPPRKRMQ